MWQKLKPYIVSALIALGVGGLSALITKDNMSEYFIAPPLSPPPVLFPIVWTVLYTLMGVSAALVYEKGKEENIDITGALGVYIIQLVVNFFWSLIFFNMRAYLFAFVWIVLLWILIITMIKRFREISPSAAYLQIPYLLWVTFAGYLNLGVFLLN